MSNDKVEATFGGETPVKTVATQVQRPWRATARTIFAAVIGLAAVTPFVLDAIAGNGDGTTLGPWAVGALAVAGAVTRVMALPQVETFLARFVPWLAADPDDKV